MAGLTNYAESILLDSLFGKASTDMSTGAGGVPSTWVLGLWRSTAANIGDGLLGTDTGECPGSTYARIKVANSSANFTNSTAGGSITNKTVFTFTTSAGSDWATVGAVVFLDSTSTVASNIWAYSTFSPQAIGSGNVVQFSTGSITVSAS